MTTFNRCVSALRGGLSRTVSYVAMLAVALLVHSNSAMAQGVTLHDSLIDVGAFGTASATKFFAAIVVFLGIGYAWWAIRLIQRKKNVAVG